MENEAAEDGWPPSPEPVENDEDGWPPSPERPKWREDGAEELSVFGAKVNTLVTCEALVVESWISKQPGNVFGMDVEWKPNTCPGDDNLVALVQICGGSECLIVQLLHLDRVPAGLVDFLQDSNKLKGGVGIKQDVKKLVEDHQLGCEGVVELGALAAEKLAEQEARSSGLRALAKRLLGISMEKPRWVSMSDWSKRHLQPYQVTYACMDAWVSYAVFEKLLSTVAPTLPELEKSNKVE